MVYSVGKIDDIFAQQGITGAIHTKNDMDGVDKTLDALREQTDKGLIFTNLVDFDAKYGHRNNPEGYAQALIDFDNRVPELLAALNPDDVLVITADHGNDPTYPGTDHTREYVPLLLTGESVIPGSNIGVRPTFADLAATIADLLEVPAPSYGSSFRELCFKVSKS